jgi:histidinol-phosphatase
VLSDLEVAHELADVADVVAAKWFSADGIETDTKADGSPVTVADREIESTIKALLADRRPRDGVLGEEVGPSGPTGRRWILDGIDGTHNFAAGRIEWGTHIALQQDGEMVLGMITSRSLGRRWWAARGEGSWTVPLARAGSATPTRVRCREAGDLGAATITAVPDAGMLKGWRGALVGALERGGVRPTAYGHSARRVAEGEVDATLHVSGGPWDHAVGVVIVEEAGGRFADLWGGRRVDTGTAVFASAALFDQVMDVVAEHRPPAPPAGGAADH